MSASNQNLAKLTLVQKADLTTADLIADGGFLNNEQSRQFLLQAVKASVAMSEATIRTTGSHTWDIDRLRFQDTVLVGATEGRELAEDERSAPDLGREQLVTSLFRAEIRLTDESIDDNIGGPAAFQRQVRTAIARAVSRDIEDAGINGDVATTIGGKRGKLIKQLDGLRKKAAAHVVDAGGSVISKDLLKRMWKALPNEYRRSKRQYRFWTSSQAETDWRNHLADRGTSLGDAVLAGDRAVAWGGINLTDVPVMPDDLGAGTDSSEILLLDPKNAHWGFWRRIRMRSEALIRAGAIVIVVDLRFGVEYAVRDAVVKMINLLTNT